MKKDINLPIRQFLKNTSFYLISGYTKTRKLLLAGLKTKYNVLIL
jgi:hypothetical protein